jgi:glycosyltransferase involved in cell wall biosynthesis
LSGSFLNTVEAYVHRWTSIYDKVDLFISPSQFLRQKHIAEGISADRIIHIPNFVVGESFQPCFEHEDYFLFAGRLTPFKGTNTLLEALARLRPSVPLLIAGDGPNREQLENQARDLDLQGVRFLGHQSGSTLRNLIARAIFVVVPSEWYENCPYAVLEAFALGTPVIATDIGGIPELVEDGLTGLLVPPQDPDALADGLGQMLENSATLPVMGRAARQRIDRTYDEKRHLEALSQAYAYVGASPL